MDTIGLADLWTFNDVGNHAEVSDCLAVRTSAGHPVVDFFELAAKIAELCCNQVEMSASVQSRNVPLGVTEHGWAGRRRHISER